MAKEGSAEATIRDIKRKTRRQYSAEEKIRIVVEGLRGGSVAKNGSRNQGGTKRLTKGQELTRLLQTVRR
jgi:transposase